MVFALSTAHQIGLASVGAAFIVFSLLSSFVFPRLKPDFPGPKGMRWYLPLAGCFFVAMIAAVLVFDREPKAASASPPTSTSAPPATGPVVTSGPYANGSATAGKAEFTAAGCGACHTLKAAGASGTIGPDLDQIASYAKLGKMPLGQFMVGAITHPPAAYVPAGFPRNVMQPLGGQKLSNKQVADIIAFVASSAAG